MSSEKLLKTVLIAFIACLNGKFVVTEDFMPFDNWDNWCIDNNVPENWFFPSFDSCNDYMLCEAGLMQRGSCAPGYYFNPVDQTCDWPENVNCVLGQLPTWPPPNNECPPPGSIQLVILPSPDFCDRFFVCINGVPIEMICRPGQHWNTLEQWCDYPDNAGCISSDPPPLPECPPNQVETLPHPSNCELFIHCSNGNRLIQRCPHLHHFDVNLGRCVIMVNAVCILDIRDGRRP